MLIPLWREHVLKICMEAISFIWLKNSEYKLFTLCDIIIIILCVNCVVWYCEIIVKKEEEKKNSTSELLIQLCGCREGHFFCSSVTMSLCRVLTEIFYWIWWSARTWLKPMQTFEMNENSDCQPDLITQHQCLISLMLMFKLEWIPTAMFQHLLESFLRRAGADQPSIKPSSLKSNTQQAHRGCCLGVHMLLSI